MTTPTNCHGDDRARLIAARETVAAARARFAATTDNDTRGAWLIGS